MKQKPAAEQVGFLHEIIDFNLRSIVEHEDHVRIVTDVMPARIVFSIFVHPSDVGLALGSGGENIDAIRRLVHTACKKTSFKADIDVIA